MSVKTVSRVVNRDPVVAAATAARVQDAIRRLGFRRDEMARALRTGGQSRMLGLVIKDLANPFYSAIARGVEEVMRGAQRARDHRQLGRGSRCASASWRCSSASAASTGC